MNIVDPGRLQAILNNTQLQIRDIQTYQFLNSLIPLLKKLDDATGGGSGGGSTTIINQISNIVQSLSAFDGIDGEDGIGVPGIQGPQGPQGPASSGSSGTGTVFFPEGDVGEVTIFGPVIVTSQAQIMSRVVLNI